MSFCWISLFSEDHVFTLFHVPFFLFHYILCLFQSILLISFYLISSHLISFYLISSHLISSHFISSYLISFYLILQHTIHNNTNQSHNAGSTNHLNPKDASPDDNANSQIGKQMSSFSGSFKNVVAYAGVAGIDGNLVSRECIKLFLCRYCTKTLDRKDDSMKFQWLITVNGISSFFW